MGYAREIREILTLRAVVIGEGHVTVECDTDRTALLGLELLAVELGRVRVCEDQVVPDA